MATQQLLSKLDSYEGQLSSYKERAEQLKELAAMDPLNAAAKVALDISAPVAAHLTGGAIQNLTTKGADVFASKKAEIQQRFRQVVQEKMDLAQKAAQDKLAQVQTRAQKAVQDKLTEVQTRARGAVEGAQARVQQAAEDVQTRAQGAVEGVQARAQGAAADIQARGQQALTEAQTRAQGAAGDVQARVQGAVADAQTNIDNAAGQARAVVQDNAGRLPRSGINLEPLPEPGATPTEESFLSRIGSRITSKIQSFSGKAVPTGPPDDFGFTSRISGIRSALEPTFADPSTSGISSSVMGRLSAAGRVLDDFRTASGTASPGELPVNVSAIRNVQKARVMAQQAFAQDPEESIAGLGARFRPVGAGGRTSNLLGDFLSRNPPSVASGQAAPAPTEEQAPAAATPPEQEQAPDPAPQIQTEDPKPTLDDGDSQAASTFKGQSEIENPAFDPANISEDGPAVPTSGVRALASTEGGDDIAALLAESAPESGGLGLVLGAAVAIGTTLASVFGGHHSVPTLPPMLPQSIPVFDPGLARV